MPMRFVARETADRAFECVALSGGAGPEALTEARVWRFTASA